MNLVRVQKYNFHKSDKVYLNHFMCYNIHSLNYLDGMKTKRLLGSFLLTIAVKILRIILK